MLLDISSFLNISIHIPPNICHICPPTLKRKRSCRRGFAVHLNNKSEGSPAAPKDDLLGMLRIFQGFSEVHMPNKSVGSLADAKDDDICVVIVMYNCMCTRKDY